MSFAVIHITDLHIDSCIDDEELKIKSISSIVSRIKKGDEILLLFTGDISWSGKTHQYDAAKAFINKLTALLSANRPLKMCLCPGNHDRFFDSIGICKFDKSFLSSVNKSSYDQLFDNYSILFSNYNSFETAIAKPSGEINKVVKYYDFNVGEKSVRVYALNSAALSTYYPESELGNPETKVDNNYKNIYIRGQYLNFPRLNKDYVFLLTHLPVDYLKDENKRHIKTHFSSSIDAIFSGHIHNDEIKEEISNHKKMLEFTTSAIDFKEMSGFSLLLFDGTTIKRKIYEFDKESGRYKDITHWNQTINIPTVKSTYYGQIISGDKYKDIYAVDAFDGSANLNIPLEELFVFPRLTYKKYNNQIDIKSFESFESKRAKNGITRIQGDLHSGKSILANYLFEEYRKLGYLPILCSGKDLEGNIKNTIKWKLKELFEKNNAIDDFEMIEKNHKILIIDNLEYGSRLLFRDALRYFGSVVFLTPSGKDFRTSEEDDEKYDFESFEIEAFYYDKRVALYEKVFNYVGKINKELVSSIVFDNLVKDIETKIKELDFDNSIDPSNLIFFTLNYLKRSGFNFSNSDSIYKARLQVELGNALKERRYQYCTTEIAEIILSHVAMAAYKDNLNYFGKELFDNAVRFRKDVYGDTPIKDIDSFIQMLVEIEFIKSKKDDSNQFAFFDRKKFAHYIAKFAVYRKHNKEDDSYLKMIIKRGIYKPLNIQILFSIASNYDYYTIPNFFIDEIYSGVMNDEVVDLNNLQSFFDKIDDNKKELQEIETSKSKRKEIRERQGMAEERARKKYLEHKEDYYYYDESRTVLKRIDELSNKIDIISVVLNSFAGNLEKEQRTKLIEMLIRIPYCLINIFLEDSIKKMNIIFVRLFDQLSKEPLLSVDYYYIKACFIAEIQSTILSIFDYGTRMLKNKAIINDVKEALEANIDNMHKTQRLMLLSFAPDKSLFVREAEDCIKNSDDKFVLNNARLIGRRFCFDNYDWVENTNVKFLNLISSGPKDKKYIKDKSKIKK